MQINPNIIKKSVISLISYDAEYLPASISSYYEYIDEIVLGLDKDRITWSGNKFTFDESKLWEQLQKIDIEDKIKLIEGNFHESKVPLENDNNERNFLREQCANDWIFSIDADEVLVNAKDFFYKFCPLIAPYRHKVDLAFTWFLPFKEFENDYLVIANPDYRWFKGDTQGFVTTKDKQFTYCRWSNNKRVIPSPLAVVHWSFCRTDENLEKKLKNFGHSDKTGSDPFFNNWRIANLDNYESLTNFKTSGFGNNQWPRLIKVPKNQFWGMANMEANMVY
jgi:hypothetical protein